MNSLSLRVSAIKNTDNLKKNSEIRLSILGQPKKYLDCFRPCGQSTGPAESVALEVFKNELFEATSIDQQLVIVRRCFTTCITAAASMDEVTEMLQVLTDMLFFAPLKHPVRNAIVKLLQKSQIYHGLIIKCLADTIDENINDLIGRHDCDNSIDDYNRVIISVLGCFENFPIALMALKLCQLKIYKVILASLATYLDDLKQPHSPAKRSELYIFIHSSVRLSLSAIHQCFDQVSVAPLEAHMLGEITRHCYALLDDVEVPMDTKLNCGIFILLKANLDSSVDQIFGEIIYDGYASNPVKNLCICFGTVTVISEVHIEENDGMSVLAYVVRNLLSIAASHSIEQNVLIGVCRALVQLSKNLLLFKLPPLDSDAAAPLPQLTNDSLTFVWSHADHYMDCVRHLSKDLLKNLLKLSVKYKPLSFLAENTLTVARSGDESTELLQCLALDYLCQVYETEFILQKIPALNEIMLKRLRRMEPHWVACYEKLMKSHSRQVDLNSWYLRWVWPTLFLSEVGVSPDVSSMQLYENLIGNCIKAQPAVTDLIFLEKNLLPTKTYLFIMWTVRKLGLNCLPTWKPSKDPIIIAAKVHISDEIRIMPLRILVESYKSTEPFSADDLNEIHGFLHYNCNCQCPAMRQQILAYTSKMFLRIEASCALAAKDPTNETPKVATEFLLKLRDLCISNLFETANFSRRTISLNLLQQTVKALEALCTLDADAVWTPALLRKLYETVRHDTYEANKALANDTIKFYRTKSVPEYLAEPLRSDTIALLVNSVKPSDSQAAAYVLEMACILQHEFSTYLEAVQWCVDLLDKGLQVAQGSLLEAARSYPLYGTVFCIKHLLVRVDLKGSIYEQWRPVIQRLLTTCKALIDVVSPIVNSSSPEGHLPNDFSELNGLLANVETSDGDLHRPYKIDSIVPDNLKTTPQMVLLCAWRTIKEVSLLLGDIALHAPIWRDQSTTTDGLITIKEVLAIGTLFQEMLAEIKHRGAFEQAYVGFSKLCVRLWRSNEPELHQCPMEWLVRMMNIISGETESETDVAGEIGGLKYEKICATRRSAGVPFMIQAIITSELQVCSSVGLNYCMQHLIDVSKTGLLPESRTHALNILRALFRCTDLGDAVSAYISDGIQCSITGYTANTWPERNSSTLLFSALMTRIFGVQRTRNLDQLNIRNKMTGRIFFLRYPCLFDFVFNQLQLATEAISRNVRPMNLHPLLLLLGRLYPSSLEGCESNLQLSIFLPYIVKCSVCPELETRRLAVKSIAALIPPNKLFEQQLNAFSMLHVELCMPTRNSNAVHGYLLQTLYLVKAMDPKQIEQFNDALLSLFYDLLKLKVMGCTNFILIKVYADILIDILIRLGFATTTATEPRHLDLLHILNEQLNEILIHKNWNLIGRAQAIKSCILLKLLITKHFFGEAITHVDSADFLLYQPFADNEFEYKDTILNTILLVLGENDATDEDDDDEPNYAYMEQDFVRTLSATQLTEITKNLRGSLPLRDSLHKIINSVDAYQIHIIKVYTILSKLTAETRSTEELLALLHFMSSEPDDLKNAILKYVNAYLTITEPAAELLVELMKHLRSAANDQHLDKLRITVALCITNIPALFWTKLPRAENVNHLLIYADVMLMLLRDDNAYVREIVTKHVMNKVLMPDGKMRGDSIAGIAEELFLDWIDEQFLAIDKREAWIFWQRLILRQLLSDNCGEDTAAVVFSKNEANSFGETMHVCRAAYAKLKSAFELVEWQGAADKVNAERMLKISLGHLESAV